MSPQARRRNLLAAAVLAVAAVLIWALWPGDPAPRQDAGAAPAAANESTGAVDTGGRATATAPPELGGPGRERLQRALEDYRRLAVYPPWSRPHDEGTAYKLTWNEPVVSDLPFVEAGGREIKFRFASDRAHVGFGETLTSWIEVWETSAPDRRLPAAIRQAWVMSNADGRQGRTVPLEYADDGTHRYTNRFVPSEHDELADAQQVRISAEVVVDGEARLITRDFTYTPRPVLEILAIRDAVRDGSLVITLDVEVFEPGLHTLEANALSGDGEVPIAYVDTNTTLQVGKTRVDLTFFGKIFRDGGIDGPYQIRDLRGFRRDVDGGANLYWSDPRVHTTRPYPRTDFGDAEWDAEEKRDKIRAFEDLIEQTR